LAGKRTKSAKGQPQLQDRRDFDEAWRARDGSRDGPWGSRAIIWDGTCFGVTPPYPSLASTSREATGYRRPVSVTMLTVPVDAGAVGDAAATTTAPLPRGTCTRSAWTPPGAPAVPDTAVPAGTVGLIRMPAPLDPTGSVMHARAGVAASAGTVDGSPSGSPASDSRVAEPGRLLNTWPSTVTGVNASGSVCSSNACTSVTAAAPSASATAHCLPSVISRPICGACGTPDWPPKPLMSSGRTSGPTGIALIQAAATGQAWRSPQRNARSTASYRFPGMRNRRLP
jgi:hypothetical protein